jgi:hypothetical protein
MSEERLKVLEMVANGNISAEEGVRLLEALGASEKRSNGHYGHSAAAQSAPGGAPGQRGKVNIELPLPSLKIPKINMGNLGDICVELKNSVVDAANKGYSKLKTTKAGKYLELHDYELDGPDATGVTRCNLKLEAQAASLRIKAGESADPLMRIKARKVQEQPVLITTFQDGQVEALLKHGLGRCSVDLSPVPHYGLNIQCAASEANFDLSGLLVDELNLENNAGSVGIELGGGVESVRLKLRSNAGDVRVKVPADYAVKVICIENLSANNFERNGLNLEESVAQSEDWDSNPRRVQINLEQNVASFNLKWRTEKPQPAAAV